MTDLRIARARDVPEGVVDFTEQRLWKMMDTLAKNNFEDYAEAVYGIVNGYLEEKIGICWVSGDPMVIPLHTGQSDYELTEMARTAMEEYRASFEEDEHP
jgi:hypothetical protein